MVSPLPYLPANSLPGGGGLRSPCWGSAPSRSAPSRWASNSTNCPEHHYLPIRHVSNPRGPADQGEGRQSRAAGTEFSEKLMQVCSSALQTSLFILNSGGGGQAVCPKVPKLARPPPHHPQPAVKRPKWLEVGQMLAVPSCLAALCSCVQLDATYGDAPASLLAAQVRRLCHSRARSGPKHQPTQLKPILPRFGQKPCQVHWWVQ
jgi:hypothetical protein